MVQHIHCQKILTVQMHWNKYVIYGKIKFTIMGMNPKTTAECDREILRAQQQVTNAKEYIASMKAQYGPNSAGVKNGKITLERHKGELERLKALRKTLK